MIDFTRTFADISATTYWIYFSILAIIYIFFLKRPRWTMTNLLFFVVFNQGFFILLDDSARVPKLIISVLTLAITFTQSIRIMKRDLLLVGMFYVFTALFFINFYYYEQSIVVGIFKFYNYVIPFLLFFALKARDIDEKEWDSMAKFILTLITFQATFSIVKLLVIGYLEGVIGSVTISGGSMAVTLPLTGLLIYWVYKNETIKGTGWIFVAYILLIGVASLKRAIWFIYPIVLSGLLLKSASIRSARTVGYAIVLVPMVFYFGLRSNPTLNPEGKVWGSFDPEFALNYALDYSGVSEEKRGGDLAQGRWGASWSLISNLSGRLFSAQGLLGFPSERSGYLDSDEFVAEDYGLKYGTMVSGIGTLMLKHGYIATFLLMMIFIGYVWDIPDRFFRNILLMLLLWNVLVYSGAFIITPTQAILFIIVCEYARVKYTAKQLRKNQETQVLST